MSLTIDLVRDLAEFARLRGEWNNVLCDSVADGVFLTWEWMHSWWVHLSPKGKLHIVTVRSDGSLVAIAPLMVSWPGLTAMHPCRVLEFIGSGVVGSDYLDLIVRRGWERPVFQKLRRYFSETALTLRLERLQHGCNTVQEFASGLAEESWTVKERKVWVCPYIDIGGQTWQSYLSTLGAEHRYNFNRRLRGLAKNFEFRFERVSSEPERVHAMESLMTLHRNRRKEMGGSNAFQSPSLVAFHERFTRLAFEQDWLRLFVMSLNNRPVASLYGLSYKKKFYFYQSGFDTSFKRYSVGLVTMGLAIQAAIEEGLDEYDMLEGGESYKSHWAAKSRDLAQVDAYPPGVTGQMLSYMAELRAGAGNIVRRGLALSRH